jgi:dihydroorotate dehydrogenase electron transfer subunit
VIKVLRGIVKTNRPLTDEVHLLELRVPGFDGVSDAGQFFMVKAGSSYDPFLRRPYSIFDCAKESVKLLVKIVGKGSELIAMMPKNFPMGLVGPLGTGFRIEEQKRHVLVAGGMGIAPLWFLAKKLERNDLRFSLIFGEPTSSKMGEMVEQEFDETLLVTDDGSRGVKALATDALCAFLDEALSEELTLYGCGPPGMLERLMRIGNERNIPVYISLEQRMACGVGVCMGCSVERGDGSGYVTVCRDGPVFLANEVKL